MQPQQNFAGSGSRPSFNFQSQERSNFRFRGGSGIQRQGRFDSPRGSWNQGSRGSVQPRGQWRGSNERMPNSNMYGANTTGNEKILMSVEEWFCNIFIIHIYLFRNSF